MTKHLPLVLVAAAAVLLAIVYFVYRGLTHTACETIFEQTADRVRGDFQFIKTKGELFLGREQLQELTEGSQKVALHLKTCCIVQQGGGMKPDQLQSCIAGAKDYEQKFVQITTIIKEAQTAKEQGNAQLAEQKTKEARQVAGTTIGTFRGIGAAVEELRASGSAGEARAAPPKRASGSEQEPNNTILEANPAEMGGSIAAEIAPQKDQDFFKFQYGEAKNRRDVIGVRLENRSATLRPSVQLHNEDKSVARTWTSGNTEGADIGFTFSAIPGKSYYVAVASYFAGSTGGYSLSVVPQKAYDQYEPNDEASVATPIKLGRKVEANIMDGSDADWYRLSGIDGKSVTVRLENKSTTLRPTIQVRDSNKSVVKDWTSANADGADLTIAFPAEPGRDYFVVVGSYFGGSYGKYELTSQ